MEREFMPVLATCQIIGFPSRAPMELFNEQWAMKIHGQSLKRLAERGGMSFVEMVINIEKLPWNTRMSPTDAAKRVVKHISSANPNPSPPPITRRIKSENP